ncbi:hypothetical protein DFAR_1670008 [Desulfarculales bacterium]
MLRWIRRPSHVGAAQWLITQIYFIAALLGELIKFHS